MHGRKLKNQRKYKGASSRDTKAVGDIVTMDHCSLYDSGMQYALNGNVISLVVRDVHTKFGAVYPANTKTSSSTVEALQRFIGNDKLKRFYSDNAEELIAVARELTIPREASQQGMPETNGIIEREV